MLQILLKRIIKYQYNTCQNNSWNNLTVRTFHSTIYLNGGRKGGSKALDPAPRSLSKKQKKRKALKKLLLSDKRDPKKEKLQERIVNKQANSKEFQSFLEKSEETLSDLLNTLQLPNYHPDMQNLLNFNKDDDSNNKLIDPYEVTHELQSLCENNKLLLPSDKPNNYYINMFSSLTTKIEYNIEKIDLSLNVLKKSRLYKDMCNILYYMSLLKLPYSNKTYNIILHLENHYYKNYNKTLELFDKMIETNISPTIYTWIEVTYAYIQQNNFDATFHIINKILKKSDIDVPIDIYINILKKYLELQKYDELVDLWCDMHFETFLLTLESFHIMLNYCIKTSQVEKAFFYYDEIIALKIDVTLETYRLLIRACAEAPHWVNGYHDIIFDAISKLEGSELKPDESIYNAIIHAFGKAGDCIASEYYFWEMIRKKIKPSVLTYNSLLYAYARSNSVGASTYGYHGRYVRPLERAYTPDEQAVADIGPRNLIKHLSSGITTEDKNEGSKRPKPQIVDDIEDDEEFAESVLEDIRSEAMEINQKKLKKEKRAKKSADKLANQIENNNLLENKTNNKLYNNEDRDDDIADDTNVDITNELDQEDELDPEILKLLTENNESTVDDELTPEQFEEFSKIIKDLENDEEFSNLLSDSTKAIGFENRIKKGLLNNKDNNTTDEITRGRKRRALPKRKKTLELEEELNELIDNDIEKADTNKNYLTGDTVVADDNMNNELDKYLANSKLDSKSDDIDYRSLFKKKFNVDPNIKLIQRTMKKSNSFEDPFVGVIPVKGALVQYDSLIGEDEKTLKERKKLIALLDGTNQLSNKSTNNIKTHDEQVEVEWDMIEFGKAPDPDYTLPLSKRRAIFMHRANLALEHMKVKNVNPDIVTLTSYLSVFAEALHPEEAVEVFQSINKVYNMKHTSRSYGHMIRMYVRIKDIDTAMSYKNQMLKEDLIPLPESYGLLLESYVHRELLVDAILILEEAAKYKIILPNKNLQLLRKRCDKLGISHPDMPSDPNGWLKILQDIRKRSGKKSSSKLQNIRTAISF